MKVYDEKDNKWIKIEFEGKVKDLMQELNLNIENYLIVRGDEAITEEDKVKNSDEIKLLSVVSGG
jgi:sulfur carrier protein ThiS